MNDRLALASKFMGGGTRDALLNDGTPNPGVVYEIDRALATADLLIARERETAAAMLHPKTSPAPAVLTGNPPAQKDEPGAGGFYRKQCDLCPKYVGSNDADALDDCLALHKEVHHAAAAAATSPSKEELRHFWGCTPSPLPAYHLWPFPDAGEALCGEATDAQVTLLPSGVRPAMDKACHGCAVKVGWLGPELSEELQDRPKPTRGRRGAPKDPAAAPTPPAEVKKRARQIREQVEAMKEPGAAT